MLNWSFNLISFAVYPPSDDPMTSVPDDVNSMYVLIPGQLAINTFRTNISQILIVS